MKQIILFSSAFLILAACNSQGEKRTRTVKAEPAKKEDLIVDKKALTKNIVPEKPAEQPKEIPPKERTIRFLPPVITDDDVPPPVQNELRDASWESSTQSADFEGSENWGEVAAPPPPPPPTPEIYDITEEPAEFPGGRAAMIKYIAENLRYPETAKEMEIQGKAYLKFIVQKDGSLSNVTIVKKVPDCPECDKEAVRLVKGMPKFIPGKSNGKAVDSFFTLPVSFKLQ